MQKRIKKSTRVDEVWSLPRTTTATTTNKEK